MQKIYALRDEICIFAYSPHAAKRAAIRRGTQSNRLRKSAYRKTPHILSKDSLSSSTEAIGIE